MSILALSDRENGLKYHVREVWSSKDVTEMVTRL